MEKVVNSLKLPPTDSISELATFWDTHDLTDFEDQLEEVTEPVFERRRETWLKISLPFKQIEAVKQIAKSEGIGHTTLIQNWVFEKLHLAGAV